MKSCLALNVASAFFVCSTICDAQNFRSGSSETERKVVLRLRYSEATRTNPGLRDALGNHYLFSSYEWQSRGDGWNGSGRHATSIYLGARTRVETNLVHEKDYTLTDRYWKIFDQEGSWQRPNGTWAVQAHEYFDRLDGLNENVSVFRNFQGTFNLSTRTRSYSGIGYSSYVTRYKGTTVDSGSSSVTINPVTGDFTYHGDYEPTSIWGGAYS